MQRVLAVYAHPDDPEVSCAGTLARWADEGAEVHLVICARGDKGSHDPEVDPDELTAVRAAEADAAATVLGLAAHENLGLPDGEVDNTLELRRAPGRAHPRACGPMSSCRAIRPRCSSGAATSTTTTTAAWASPCSTPARPPHRARSTSPRPATPHRVPTIYLSGTLHPDTWEDIATTLDRKVEALRCHRSQVGDDLELVGEVVRRRASSAGAEAGLAHAEAFRVLAL